MEPKNQLTAEAAVQFQQGINLVLSRWHSLQFAVANETGGRRSLQKSQQLADRIFSFFAQSKEDDLADFLDEFMSSGLGIEYDCTDIEEVTKKMTIMHKQCAQGNFELINELKRTIPGNSAVTYRIQEEDSSDDEDDDIEDESSDMEVEASECQASLAQKDMMVDETEDGWTRVSSRRKNGTRN